MGLARGLSVTGYTKVPTDAARRPPGELHSVYRVRFRLSLVLAKNSGTWIILS